MSFTGRVIAMPSQADDAAADLRNVINLWASRYSVAGLHFTVEVEQSEPVLVGDSGPVLG